MNVRKISKLILLAVSLSLVTGIWSLQAWGAKPPLNLPTQALDNFTFEGYKPAAHPMFNSYWIEALSTVPAGYDVLNQQYPGWCVDKTTGLSPGSTHQVKLYNTSPDSRFVIPSLPSSFHPARDVWIDGGGNLQFTDSGNGTAWNMVNWIINNRNVGIYATYPWWEVQDAIWGFIDGPSLPPLGSNARTLFDAALLHGTYVPVVGEVVAVGCYVDESHQVSIIEVPVPKDVSVGLSSVTGAFQNGNVTLQWVTQSETENLGFRVYRSLTQDGDYEKVTASLVEGAGSSRATRTYQFVDPNVKSGVTYYYALEQVDFSGAATRYDPVAVTTVTKPVLQTITWGQMKSSLK